MQRIPDSSYLFTVVVLAMFALVLAFSATSDVAQAEPASQDTPAMAGERGRHVAEAAQGIRQDSGGAVAISFNEAAGDDTVAHEWDHAYTEYTNNPICQWQSGALNESYSDIWGEIVDLINGRDLDTPDVVRPSGYCSSNPEGANFPRNPSVITVRRPSGESDPAFDQIQTGSGNASGTTDGSGVATLDSPKEKQVSGEWNFCVDNLSFGAGTYNPAANEETRAGTSAPVTVGMVSGTVSDNTNGGSLACVLVETDTGQSSTTDSNGVYTITSIPTGSRTITVSKCGYLSQNKPANVTNGGNEVANFALDEIIQRANPTVTCCSPSSGTSNQRMNVTVNSSGFQRGATVDFGAQIAVQNVTFTGDSELSIQIKIQKQAQSGPRTVMVTNPDGGSGSLAGCFSVN